MSAELTGQEEPENMEPNTSAEEIKTTKPETVEETPSEEVVETTPTMETPEETSAEETSAQDGMPEASAEAAADGGSDVEAQQDDEEGISASDEDADDDEEDDADADSPPESSAETLPPPRYKRGDLVEGTISETTPTSVTVALEDDLQGIILSRELERMSRPMLESLAVGEKVTVYVVNPRDHRGRVILSVNRALEEIDWQEAERYRAAQEIYEGNIAGYNKGGLIVRFGRLRGFVPQSQIGDERRRSMQGETPQEMYDGMVNADIFVKVMEVDRGRNRLILSERAASREIREQKKEDLISELNVGEVRVGHVVSLEDFGVFVDVGGAEGLVHLTEISWKHVNHPRDVLKVGQEVKVEVISIDRERKRIGLSIKRQEADPWDEVATTYQVGDLVQGTVTKLTKFGAFARLVDAEDIEGLIHISELSDDRVNHPREVVDVNEKLTLRVVKIDVKNRRLGLSLKKVHSSEYLDRDLQTFADDTDE